MYLMIDNYDSFVYNLRAYFEELGKEIIVKRSDRITMEEIEEMQPEGIILSPGPEETLGCGSLCRDSKKISGQDSYSWSLSGTPGSGVLFRGNCRERQASHAWQSYRDCSQWQRSV